MTLREELESALGESVSDAQLRESTMFQNLRTAVGRDVVLFGAGGLGRKTLGQLRSIGIEPVAFSDNSDSRWGSQLDGVPVLSPSTAVETYGTTAVFVVTIWGAASPHRFEQTATQLKTLGCKAISTYPWLAWSHPTVMLPYYSVDLPSKLLVERQEILEAFELLSDDFSRREYVSQVKWRLGGDPSVLASPVSDIQYLVPEANLERTDVVFDCGAYDGDTLTSWVDAVGSFSTYVALEPDAQSRSRLEAKLGALGDGLANNVHVLPYAVASQNGTATFLADGTGASSFLRKGDENRVTVECRRIDDLVSELNIGPPTFLKMDIEGAEIDALLGATAVLSQARPKMALCVYHRQSDLWKIPKLVSELCGSTEFYLRPHNEQGWDLVCYAMPNAR